MYVAAAIVICMVLHLVNEHHQWRAFWKVSVVLALLILAGLGYGLYESSKPTQHSQQQEIPPLPAGYVLDPPTVDPAPSPASTTPAKQASDHPRQ